MRGGGCVAGTSLVPLLGALEDGGEVVTRRFEHTVPDDGGEFGVVRSFPDQCHERCSDGSGQHTALVGQQLDEIALRRPGVNVGVFGLGDLGCRSKEEVALRGPPAVQRRSRDAGTLGDGGGGQRGIAVLGQQREDGLHDRRGQLGVHRASSGAPGVVIGGSHGVTPFFDTKRVRFIT